MLTSEIVAAARQCLGTPFVHQGRVVGVGLDCAGVCCHVAGSFGLDVVEVQGYGETPNKGMLEQALDMQDYLMVVEDMRPGDILLMRFFSEPQHLAILTEDNTIIHAYETIGSCVEHGLDDRWLSRIVRIYRFKAAV